MDTESEVIARLRAKLKAAATARRPFAAAVARHSMGGQSIPRDGTAITFTKGSCEINSSAMTFSRLSRRDLARCDRHFGQGRVLAGGHAVHNDFGVGSTFCVNAHGWPVPYGPFGSTVRAVRVMLADGSILKCSHEKNSDLFGLAIA